MALDISAQLKREKNKLANEHPWIALLEIQITSSVSLYFCDNTEDITYNGHTYTAFPFMIDPIKQTSKGEMPTVSLMVANVTQVIHEYLELYDGGVESKVILTIVHSDYVENAAYVEDFTELEMEFSVLKTEAVAEWITFTLGAINPLRRRYPNYRFMARHCNWEFKSIECKYAGEETVCDRTYDRCEELNNVINFGGHHGLSQKGWRVA